MLISPSPFPLFSISFLVYASHLPLLSADANWDIEMLKPTHMTAIKLYTNLTSPQRLFLRQRTAYLPKECTYSILGFFRHERLRSYMATMFCKYVAMNNVCSRCVTTSISLSVSSIVAKEIQRYIEYLAM